jgi:hypothetical protein
VARIYNPRYSEGRDKEDLGSKPALANNSQDPILKKQHKYCQQSGLRCKLRVQTPVLPKTKQKEKEKER